MSVESAVRDGPIAAKTEWRRHAMFLPRDLHPAAWWIWALGMAVATSRTTNPLLLALAIAVSSIVVVARRSDAPWALSFRLYLILGAWIILLRVAFRIIFGGGEGPTILFTLPEIPLPAWAAGIRLFGAVSLEAVLGGLYDGLRLAAMVICLGAANALANPKRLLKALPSALYEVGTAVIVALSVFPQLAESVLRVRRARRLRGGSGKRMQLLRAVAIPVLEDALERSLQLAASMDARGYGRSGEASRGARRLTGLLMLVGLSGVCVGIYCTLDGSTPRLLATPMLIAGVVVALAGFQVAGRRVHRVRYRPDRWHVPEVLVAASGFAVAAVTMASSRVDPTNLNPSLVDLAFPTLSWLPLVGISLGLLPLLVSPLPASPYAGRGEATGSAATDETAPPAGVEAPPAAAHTTLEQIR